MSLCPVPYVVAGMWLYRRGAEMSKTPRGRVKLVLVIAAATAAAVQIYRWRKGSRKRRQPVPPPIGLDRRLYALSDQGFVPSVFQVMQRLPPKFDIWETTAERLPELARSHEIRDVIDAWTCLEPEELLHQDSIASAQRAYSILSMIAQAYVWCDEEKPRSELPVALAAPLVKTASFLDIQPVVTHAAVDLWNFRRRPDSQSQALKMENLQCLTTMTGTVDEEWFYLTSTVCQSLAGPVLLEAYDLHAEAIPTQDVRAVEDFLDLAQRQVAAMVAALARLPERCTPNTFWKVLRPFLQGSGSSALPNGLLFKGVQEKPMRLAGASAAQSTAVPIIDAVFGVRHGPALLGFLEEMRAYMPGPHRDYLELMQAQDSLREALLRWRRQKVAGADALIPKFNRCIDELLEFRKMHWNLVGSHIIAMKQADVALAQGCPVGGGGAKSAVQGTGGSALDHFLGGTIKATMAAKIPET